MCLYIVVRYVPNTISKPELQDSKYSDPPAELNIEAQFRHKLPIAASRTYMKRFILMDHSYETHSINPVDELHPHQLERSFMLRSICVDMLSPFDLR